MNQSTISAPESEKALVAKALDAVLDGGTLDSDTLYRLADIATPEARQALRDGAAEITARFAPREFDSCSIVNARSGNCPENCKWCAQSSHSHTGCDTYAIVDREEAHNVAKYNAAKGVKRFSLVASGRSVKGRALKEMADLLLDVRRLYGISTCASLGLLNRDELQTLWDAGVHRYHCNLETAPSHFPTLCTSHTQADKLATIRAAKEIGFEVCSGGIIGMGETRRQRMELAITLREVEPASIPINVLCPIPGTPLADTPLISEDEIIDTVAMFRFAHPHTQLRLAGGRARLSHATLLTMLRCGINGGVVGDLLTTIGSTIEQDKALVAEAGYKF